MPRAVRSTNIGLHHLRSAVAAGDCGSFRQAAEFLEIRHSVLSRSISQFEHLVGATLFERSTGGVVPTPAGRSILRMSRMILEQVDTLVTTGKSSGRGDAGRLSVGFCTSISAGNLRASLIEFRRRAPLVELATVERSCIRLMNALRSGTIDVAVVPGGRTPPDQKSLPVWSERILILLPKDHPLATQNVVHWTDLRNETLLLSQHDPGDDIEDLLISKLMAPEDRPKVERHDVSRGIVKSLIGMGLGVSLVMESDVGATFAGIVYRELQDGTGPSRIGFHVQWLADNENPVLKRFIELLTERYPSPSRTVD
ncbi:LysR substrate-binding domain-containing protein [Bradyrhizobium sp. ISRA443]|uniref:LysR family transcriptional regulator n=1 Tax=unclassified Bradyrhizobium TaxID=2631580 RepID=UPI002479313E|nr:MULTISPECIES: LysR family transcriptional regulator [unclassified Bradyrhizobium]WGR93010.1 LysR substrate-binding domain-containing protein [Bradyrhizobium sp. ISRA435]WGR97502.1 LysR substrate-binding domain-containing protein [Bradyrhizobium sp. ISRA436]WGS04392.1 LysR substrate-binding domain-containing protein [Bradyrhizobium sp. ISRA437]WGS11274.1 LysR substrate-binding domain-containing protein [Bradyrhizobium sp. ISRA443]